MGEFLSDDLILVICRNGDFFTTNFDLSNHYEDNILIIEKFDSSKVWTAALWDADQKYNYLKRFQLESSSRKQNFLGENTESRLLLLTDEAYPRIEVIFGGHDSFRETLVLDAEEFISVKGFKAKGKRISTYEVETVNELEPVRFAQESKNISETVEEDEENLEDKSNTDILDEITGQMKLFDE